MAQTPLQRMSSWTTAEVSEFMAEHDAAGLAPHLAQNAVNGAELASFASWEALSKELRLTPFAAKKVLRLRDSFLHNADA